MEIKCPYCNKDAELVGGDVIYPSMKKFHSNKKFWLCRPCNAYIKTRENSNEHAPMGIMANAELRGLKKRVYKILSFLWDAKMKKDGVDIKEARRSANEWLTSKLGLASVKECYVNKFSAEICKQVIEICKPYLRKE